MIFKHRSLVECQLAGENRTSLIQICQSDFHDIELRTATSKAVPVRLRKITITLWELPFKMCVYISYCHVAINHDKSCKPSFKRKKIHKDRFIYFMFM